MYYETVIKMYIYIWWKTIHRGIANIRRTLGNKLVDHSDVVGAAQIGAYRRCSNYIFILDQTPGFSGLGKENCKTRRETFKLWDLVCIVLEIWRYF